MLAEAAITPRTRAILAVHQLGMPCDLAALVEISRRRGVPLIEDAACASGSQIRWDDRWDRIGKPHGDVACFSFHPRKVMSTGDGGMLTTPHKDWDARFRLLRQHGMSVPDTVRHSSAQVIFETHPVVGFNYRMTDIQAAVGREQLKRLPEIIEARRRLADRYRAALANKVPELGLPQEPDYARSNWQSFCVRLPEGRDQRTVMQALLDAGVATRRGVMCAHREASYAEAPRRFPLPASEAAQDQCIILPLYPQMTEGEVERVADALEAAIT